MSISAHKACKYGHLEENWPADYTLNAGNDLTEP